MKILHRYIFQHFLRYFLASLMGGVVLFLTADFFEKVDDLIEVSAPIPLAVHYFVLKLPFIITYIWAPSALMGALFTSVVFHRHRESVAIKAAGIGPRVYLVPVMILAALMAVSFFIFREIVEKPLTLKSEGIWEKEIRDHGGAFARSEKGLWYATKNTIFRLGFYDPKHVIFYRVSVFVLNDHFLLDKRMEADVMKWNGNSWVLENVTVFSFSNGGVAVSSFPFHNASLDEKPQDLVAFRSFPETLGCRQLYRLIRIMKEEGLEAGSYEVEFMMRFSDAIWVFLACGIGIMVGNHRKFAPHTVRILSGGVVCYAISFGLYQAGIAISSVGILPSLPGIWSPFCFILAWGMREMRYLG